MDIDLKRLLTLAQAAALLPGRPHVNTIHRWTSAGLRGLRLQTWVVGGRRVTTEKALHDFIRLTTEARNGAVSSQPSRKGNQAALVEQELDRHEL